MKQGVLLLLLLLSLVFVSSYAAADGSPAVAAGEMRYRGTGKFDACESVIVEFIFSAAKSEIRDLTITLNNINVVVEKDNMKTERKVKQTKTEFPSPLNAVGGNAAFAFGDLGSLSINGLGQPQASGELTYNYSDTGSQTGAKETVPLGSTPLAFQAVSQ